MSKSWIRVSAAAAMPLLGIAVWLGADDILAEYLTRQAASGSPAYSLASAWMELSFAMPFLIPVVSGIAAGLIARQHALLSAAVTAGIGYLIVFGSDLPIALIAAGGTALWAFLTSTVLTSLAGVAPGRVE